MVRTGAAALATLAALLVFGAVSAAGATVTPVMTGLDNPRGLAFGPDGALYVTEGGRGGPGPPFRVVRGETQGFGATGAISRLRDGVQEKWLTGLPSLARPSGAEAEGGPQDIAFAFRTIPFFGRNDAYVTIGLGGTPPTSRVPLGPAGTLMGKLIKVSAARQITEIADIAAYEEAVNPAGGPIDSNPYGLLALSRQQIVADAGANAVFSVAGGAVETLAVFPGRPNPTPIGPPFIDSVPTATAVGPDGALYVSELTGVPFLTGFARIHRIAPNGSTSVYATGLTTVVDLAFGDDGALYALQHASCGPFFTCPGSIVQVAASAPHPVVYGGLSRPAGMTIGRDDAFYVSNRGASAAVGEVLRIAP
ncbi:MAG: ScyD/ScyE family protein [Actinomycetota bacterium]|nr:ScyD/ScyE family protein [Actinomycetota bacterium]